MKRSTKRRGLPIVRTSSTPLPPLYARWFDDFLTQPTPAEEDSTCEDCVMCREPPPDERYDPDVRCCTYLPRLPNFLVGAALGRSRSEGRLSIEARIEAGDGVTPWGLDTTAVFDRLYPEAWSAFGRSKALRCPHYVEKKGQCGIWQDRNGVCSTFFCKPVRGPIGLSFWNGARDLLRTIEEELAYVCLLEIGFPEEPLRQMLAKHGAPHAGQGPPSGLTHFALEGRADPDAYRAVWGPWIGRESAVYAACWKIVAGMSWTDVVARCGPKVRAHMHVVAAEHRRLMSTDLPKRLRLGVLSIQESADDPAIRILTPVASKRHIDADAELWEALQCFRGQSVTKALDELRDRLGVTFEPPTLLRLVDMGVLVEA